MPKYVTQWFSIFSVERNPRETFQTTRGCALTFNILIYLNPALNCKIAEPLDCTGETPIENSGVAHSIIIWARKDFWYFYLHWKTDNDFFVSFFFNLHYASLLILCFQMNLIKNNFSTTRLMNFRLRACCSTVLDDQLRAKYEPHVLYRFTILGPFVWKKIGVKKFYYVGYTLKLGFRWKIKISLISCTFLFSEFMLFSFFLYLLLITVLFLTNFAVTSRIVTWRCPSRLLLLQTNRNNLQLLFNQPWHQSHHQQQELTCENYLE